VNFDLSEDEEMLKALTERFVTNRYDNESRRKFLSEPAGFSAGNWAVLGELGLIAAPLDAEAGGLALDATAIATVFEALGRGLVVEPLVENVMVAARLFAATATPPLRDAWLPDLVSGERRLALAHAEIKARSGLLWVETTAQVTPAGVRLDGAKAFVAAGAGADGYIVSARTAGHAADPAGVGLYLVPANAAGLSINPWRWADGTLGVSLTLDGVVVGSDHSLAGGAAEIAEIEVLANLARCAEALGIMERLFADTIEYLKTREQFGAKLGSFQAIQHRMVAQYAAIEQGRALLNLALVSYDTPGFATAVQGARAFIAAASVALGHEMIQFHGGMGTTNELPIGHGHKRLLVLSRWPDDPDMALDRYAGIAA
jgi:alkylation response protein AidB-like acyl-CoA dehydrogenase